MRIKRKMSEHKIWNVRAVNSTQRNPLPSQEKKRRQYCCYFSLLSGKNTRKGVENENLFFLFFAMFPCGATRKI